MSYEQDIQTIARTKDILDKLDKVLVVVDANTKETIEAKRIASAQSDKIGQEAVGGNGSTNTNGTNASGSSVTPPLAPPTLPVPDATNSVTSGSVDAINNIKSNMDILKAITGGDLSDKAKEYDTNNEGLRQTVENPSPTGGGSSRTDKKDQADPDNATGPNAAGWEEIRDTMVANGATQDQIDEARRQYWSGDKGTHEVSDVYEGTAGPQLTEGNWTSIAPNELAGLHVLVTSSIPILNSVVGVDPDDTSVAMEVRFDGRPTIPSIAESEAALQEPWTDLDTPPLKPNYTAGYYWVTTGSGGDDSLTWDSTPQGSAKIAEAIYNAANPSDPATFRELEDDDSGSPPSTPMPDRYISHYTRPLGGDFELSTGAVACIGTGTDYCPIDPPTEDVWPPIGFYTLSLVNGQFIHSIYDSEVPSKFRSTTAAVLIASAITGDIYKIEPSINGGFMIHNQTNPSHILLYGADRSLRGVVDQLLYNFYKPR